ncbi:acyltransferase [Mucilaginibacter pallidiroseus]|uniref:Acyltransferase n=1 Tax=Mucilaginibacter pallidiroseus TaxID=2599295 RepID=A0A563UI09_9SPHI|nr:acyltransferase [Mucilaginibacter pallidiroseus]TWR31040.1 acyltransferase [Mucilaginibacter pallidiroseus]
MSITEKLKSQPRLKKFLHWLLVKTSHSAPRKWVIWFINPFVHKRSNKALIMPNARLDLFPFKNFEIGPNSIIEDFSVINNGVGDVIIGHHVGVGISNVIIGPVTLGNYVMLAQHIVFSGLNHGFADVTKPPRVQPVITKPIVVEDNVWIGANSTVTAGVKIGKNAIIGAGSVVTKDIPAYTVAVGNPARVIKKYNFETAAWERV